MFGLDNKQFGCTEGFGLGKRHIVAAYWSTETLISDNQEPMRMASFYKGPGL